MQSVAVVFDTSAPECRRRNKPRLDRLPQGVLAGQFRKYASVRAELAGEGFAEVLTEQPVQVVAPVFAAAARNPLLPIAPGVDARLRFGLQVSRWDIPGGSMKLAENLREVAGAAESAGFDSIWVMDHL